MPTRRRAWSPSGPEAFQLPWVAHFLTASSAMVSNGLTGCSAGENRAVGYKTTTVWASSHHRPPYSSLCERGQTRPNWVKDGAHREVLLLLRPRLPRPRHHFREK